MLIKLYHAGYFDCNFDPKFELQIWIWNLKMENKNSKIEKKAWNVSWAEFPSLGPPKRLLKGKCVLGQFL
jgi:hypothetical protein